MKLIADAKQSGVRIGICSSSPSAWANIVIDVFKLADYVDSLSTPDIDECPGKPHPALYTRMLRKLGMTSDKCIAIEDSSNGILAARQNHIFCFGLLNGSNRIEDVRAADIIVASLGDRRIYQLFAE